MTSAFDSTFKDKQAMLLFESYCKQEYSIENFAAYNDIQQFKKTKNDAMLIYQRYLSGALAVMEINCPQKTCQNVLTKIQAGSIDETLFDSIEFEVLSNLTDTWTRFILWDKYVKYRQNSVSDTELIEGKKQ